MSTLPEAISFFYAFAKTQCKNDDDAAVYAAALVNAWIASRDQLLDQDIEELAQEVSLLAA